MKHHAGFRLANTFTLRDTTCFRASVSDIKHAAMIPEVQSSLLKWVKTKVGGEVPGVLIGGLAMSFYAPPRATQDVDLLFMTESDIPEQVQGFRRRRSGAFEDTQTNVEVEVVVPRAINLPVEVARRVLATAVVHQDLRVASLEGLVVLKLFGSDSPKRHFSDLGDIQRLLVANPHLDLKDLSEWNLSTKHKELFENVKATTKE